LRQLSCDTVSFLTADIESKAQVSGYATYVNSEAPLSLFGS